MWTMFCLIYVMYMISCVKSYIIIDENKPLLFCVQYHSGFGLFGLVYWRVSRYTRWTGRIIILEI